MTYKSERSKKRYYFRSFCRFSSLVRRESQASMIPSTIMTSSRHSIFAQTSLSLAESDLPKVPASRSLEYSTMPPGSQCRSFIRLRARFMKIYTLPLQGSCPMVCDDTAEGMEAFAHISRTVIQQIAHTVIKAEHGCRPR